MVSYLAALAAAVVNAASNVLNRKATRSEPAQDRFRLRLIIHLIRDRIWLASVAAMVGSFLLQSVALGTGQLASVQIIIVLELPLTLIGGIWALGLRLGAREWAAIAAMTVGVIGVLAALDPRPGGTRAVPPVDWIAGAGANTAAVVALFLAARFSRSPARQSALLGAAAGLGYGLAAAFTKGMTQQFAAGGVIGVIASWQLYAAAAMGFAATWLLENAYHVGRLTAAQPGITLLDPLTATCWGVLIFGEHVRGGGLALVALVPLAVLAAGVIVLSRSPFLRTSTATRDSDASSLVGPRDHARR